MADGFDVLFIFYIIVLSTYYVILSYLMFIHVYKKQCYIAMFIMLFINILYKVYIIKLF